jgi:hypothetical protein
MTAFNDGCERRCLFIRNNRTEKDGARQTHRPFTAAFLSNQIFKNRLKIDGYQSASPIAHYWHNACIRRRQEQLSVGPLKIKPET